MLETASNKADQVINEIADIAVVEFLPIVGPARGKVLSAETKKANPKRILEIGTFIGYSTILMAREIGKKSQIITIEEHETEAEVAKNNISQTELDVNVQVINGDAVEVIPTLKGTFDFVFLDAAKEEYYHYLQLMENKLVKGAILVADNAGKFATEMKDYLDYVRTSGKYQSRYIGISDDGIEISLKL
ncbi:MAG: class I SAM-dependent methyltransferase [Candidatus Bathyarchaeota archaeon]|uniref:O-methyltransferase n=2 Tax=Candidatus Bathycorpusculum sp. TaxID=2994959 RepID=UPI00281E87C7|nr:class I SAM-dependent methyltransferase [Candidatus Termiticorpusculum sp.]MCL2292124.1 class I SAM-dependent methyltransferase [Candidatus Termiticorpusculum sp.]